MVAFLGLTHYAAGLDRARPTLPAAEPAAAEPGPAEAARGDDVAAAAGAAAEPAAEPAPPVSAWVHGAESHPEPFRWVTIPMLLLIAFTVFIAIAGLIAAA